MKTMLEMPDYSVSHFQARTCKGRIQDRIQWNNAAVVHIVSNLPTNTAAGSEGPDALANNSSLLIEIILQFKPPLILFPDVVRRGGDNKLQGFVRDCRKEIKAIPVIDNNALGFEEFSRYFRFIKHAANLEMDQFWVKNSITSPSKSISSHLSFRLDK